MASVARKLMTVAEFAEFDDGTDRRRELIGGEIVMMSPSLRPHRILASRLDAALRTRLRPPCEPEVEAGILLPWSANDYYEADLAVSCAPVTRELWCPDPILIVEVLSDSTERKDRRVKLPAYRRLPSVRDILFIATDEVLVEHYARVADGSRWEVQDLGPGDTIRLEGLGIEFPLDELYAGLPLGPEEALGG
jgi:Uma2 family endonuclease